MIDGSYVTAKEEPGDIDLILALRPDFDLTAELRRQVEEYVGITAAIQVWQMRGEPPAEVRFPG